MLTGNLFFGFTVWRKMENRAHCPCAGMAKLYEQSVIKLDYYQLTR